MLTNSAFDKICTCKRNHVQNKRAKKFSFLMGLVLAILPKCPFCVFGYSAVLTMCSGASQLFSF